MFVAVFASSCARMEPAARRVKLANRPGEFIKIGVAWSSTDKENKLVQGLKLAAEEINESGEALGRKVKLIYRADEGDVTKGRLIAQEFANNPEITAVIGHESSYVSIPCASIYQFGGLLMLSPTSTNPKLTKLGHKLIFRMIPNDNIIGTQLADYAAKKGYEKAAIFYVKNDYGKGLANAIEKRAEEAEIEVVDRISCMQDDESFFRKVLRAWKDEYVIDVIFLAGELPGAALFIREAREMGLRVPIIGGDALAFPELWEVGGAAVEGTVVASVFHPDNPRREVKEFNKKFRKKHNILPDSDSALGYDSLKLLAYAINKADSIVPDKVADALHSTKRWEGVTGTHAFNTKGDDVGMGMVKLIVKNGKFEYLE